MSDTYIINGPRGDYWDDFESADRPILVIIELPLKADLTAVYCNFGINGGMRRGIDRAKLEGRSIEMRTIPGWSL